MLYIAQLEERSEEFLSLVSRVHDCVIIDHDKLENKFYLFKKYFNHIIIRGHGDKYTKFVSNFHGSLDACIGLNEDVTDTIVCKHWNYGSTKNALIFPEIDKPIRMVDMNDHHKKLIKARGFEMKVLARSGTARDLFNIISCIIPTTMYKSYTEYRNIAEELS